MATKGAEPPHSLTQARVLQSTLLELHSLVRSLDRALCSTHGLSVAQCHALRLWSEVGALTVNDVAARLRLDKSTASRLVAALEGKGYLARARDRGDGRLVWIEATPDGHRVRMRVEEARCSHYAEILREFDPEVRMAMNRLLARLVASFSAHTDDAEDTARPTR